MPTDSVRIYTFKAGLLSRVAHDLRLHVEPHGVRVTRTGDRVEAEFDPSAIVVDGAVDSDGTVDVDELSRRDRAKIVDNIQTEILDVKRHPKIRFSGSVTPLPGDRLDVAGELELAGVRRPLRFVAQTQSGSAGQPERVEARVTLQPSEFGIPPYKALAGAIRLQDRVVVELDLAAPTTGD